MPDCMHTFMMVYSLRFGSLIRLILFTYNLSLKDDKVKLIVNK